MVKNLSVFSTSFLVLTVRTFQIKSAARKRFPFLIFSKIDGRRRIYVSILSCNSGAGVLNFNIDKTMRNVTLSNRLACDFIESVSSIQLSLVALNAVELNYTMAAKCLHALQLCTVPGTLLHMVESNIK